MKVFVTLATILGVAYAEADAHMGQMKSGLQQHNNVMHMSAVNVMPNMKMRLSTPYQAHTGPSQYHLQDEFGNFEYAYANQNSEKMEKGNDMSVKGQYAYIMSDGVLRRVDYVADNYGFHILQDNADTSRSQDRIKRSVEPNLIQTRMTSIMDSSPLMDGFKVNPNMYNMMGRDMSSKNMMQRYQMNDMSSNRNMYNMMDRPSNMMGQEMVGRNMMNENMRGQNMMNDNILGREMYNNMMARDMSSNMMTHNVMGQDMRNMMNKNMMDSNMMGNSLYSNMMGRAMPSYMMDRDMPSDMMGQEMSSNMMGNSMTTYSNNVNSLPLGQHNTMSQRVQTPQSAASNRFF